MPTSVLAVIAMSLIAAGWFAVAFCWRPPSALKSIVKTASVAGLAFAAVLMGGPSMLVAALALGAVGDFFLSRPGQGAFLAGLIAFAAAHLAYIALLAGVGAVLKLTAPSVLSVVLAMTMGTVLFRYAGPLRWPVMAYVTIIAMMGLMAIGLPTAMWLAVIAAFCFVLSDSVLGFGMFVLPDQHPLRRVTPFIIWFFYWVAQLLFLLAFGGVQIT